MQIYTKYFKKQTDWSFFILIVTNEFSEFFVSWEIAPNAHDYMSVGTKLRIMIDNPLRQIFDPELSGSKHTTTQIFGGISKYR